MHTHIHAFIYKRYNERTDKNEYITINLDHFSLEEGDNYLNAICVISKSSQ